MRRPHLALRPGCLSVALLQRRTHNRKKTSHFARRGRQWSHGAGLGYSKAPVEDGAWPPAPASAATPLSFDVGAAASRQSDFLWNVSEAHYEHPAFLSDAARRYAQLLHLMAATPGAFLVPLYGASELPQAFCRTAVRPTCTKEQRCVN